MNETVVDLPINQRIKLSVIPTKQFKTIQIMVDFAGQATPSEISERALLSYVQAVSSRQYPNQQAVAQALINLYGAQYQTDVLRFGKYHQIRFSIQCPHPKYLNLGNEYLLRVLSFLEEMIFNPLADSQTGFNAQVLAKEQAGLISELASVSDDKERLALANLRRLTFPEDALQISSMGTIRDVKRISAQGLYYSHQQILTADWVSISVLGDVIPAEIQDTIKDWLWPEHTVEVSAPKAFYRLPVRVLAKQTDYRSNLNQAILTQNYYLPIPVGSDQRFAAIVFNAMFGGLPMSKLFMNIREKESLAYSIYSRWQYDLGIVTVLAGIDAVNTKQVTTLIANQLLELQTGNFSDQLLADSKRALINDYLSQLDSPFSRLGTNVTQNLTGRVTTQADWIRQVQNVSRFDIQKVANMMTLRQGYNLLPKEDHGKAI